MKFIVFPNATGVIPTTQINNGKPEIVNIPFYKEQGWAVLCAQLEKDDLKEIAKNGGCVYVIMQTHNIPPISLQTGDPFKPKSKITDLTGKPYEQKDTTSQDKASPGDDKQPNAGDNRIFKSEGPQSGKDK